MEAQGAQCLKFPFLILYVVPWAKIMKFSQLPKHDLIGIDSM